MELKAREYTIFDNIRIPFQCSPFATLFGILIMIVKWLLPTVQIFAIAMFIDRSLYFLQKKNSWEALITPLFFIGGIILFNQFEHTMSSLCQQLIGNGLRSKFKVAITEKWARLHYTSIEKHEIWDLFTRVKYNSDTRMLNGYYTCLTFFGIALQLTGFLSVLFINVWWSLFMVVFILCISLVCGLKGGQKQYATEQYINKYKMRSNYLDELLINKEAVNERHLFGYHKKLSIQWHSFFDKATKMERSVIIKWIVQMKIISSFMSITTFALAVALLFPVSKGELSVGLFIAIIQASANIVSILSWQFSDQVNKITRQSGYLKDLTAFSKLEEVYKATEPPAPAFNLQTIEFKNVSFKYPGSKHYVLQDLNLKIQGGRHYAIVGTNGAGKTTLTKLLTGLYTDFTGDILINGSSIKNFSLPELKALTAVLFQDFACYQISMRDNIAIGNMENFYDFRQNRDIENLAVQFGLQEIINELPDGINTHLGKLHEKGVELSGGQWQRLAMARLMRSDAPLYILDEPTASLDPVSESKLYEEFEQIIHGKTTLFISHRLGSAKLADEIFVLDGGQVIQRGTHNELMNQCGHYRSMFESQRSWYL